MNHNCVEKLVETRWVCTEGLSLSSKMISNLLSYSSHICQAPLITIMCAPAKMNSLWGILFADPVLSNRRARVCSGAYRAFRQRLTKHEPLSRLFCKHCFNDGVGGVSEDKHGSASTMCPQEAHGKGHRHCCLTLHERLRDRGASASPWETDAAYHWENAIRHSNDLWLVYIWPPFLLYRLNINGNSLSNRCSSCSNVTAKYL